MPAILVKGTTFSAGGEVNAAELHALIAGASMAGLDYTNLSDDFSLIRTVDEWAALSTLKPGVSDKTFWLYTQLADGTPASLISHGYSFVLDSGSASVLPGDVLSPVSVDATTGEMTCTKSITTERWKCCGAAMTDALPGGRGVMITQGIARVNTDGTGNAPGDNLAPSGTVDGKFVSSKSVFGPWKAGVVIYTHGVSVWGSLFR